MSLAPGDQLGPYEILAPLGAGGMGEVFQARDTRLNRIVAIKTSKAQFSERFEREARAVAALNHPNICQLYDLGSLADGSSYLVMEFIEGAPITAPDSPRQLIDLATQITDGLAAAHGAGFIHRDLKPDNILLTGPKSATPGRVKILDFGLAKRSVSPPSDVESDQTVTLALNSTSPGTILGTVAYMSPEQAPGQEVDARSDQFSFGLILYELASGRRAFSRSTAAETMAAIIRDEPAPLPATVPAPLRWVIERCLAKDPADRYDSTRDLYRELKLASQRLTDASSTSVSPVAAPLPKTSRFIWVTAALGAIAVAALGFAAWQWFGKPAASTTAGAVHLFLPPPENTVLTSLGPNSSNVILSPNGRFLAFLAERGSKQQLWVLTLSTGSAQLLDRVESPVRPFWSPDSQNIAFFSGDKLKRVPITGGPPLDICSGAGEGGTWNSDGVIVFSADNVLKRVPAAGGAAIPISDLDASRQETQHAWPQFLPDGRLLFLARTRQPGQSGVFVRHLGSADKDSAKKEAATKLATTATRAVFAAPDQLLYVRSDAALVSQTVDLNAMKLVGEAVPVAQQIRANLFNGRNAFSVSSNGILAYRAGGSGGQSQLAWYSRAGRRLQPLLPFARGYRSLELSPDGRMLAVEQGAPGNLNLWVLNVGTNVFSQLTFSSGEARYPIWSPDSRFIAYREGDSLRRLTVGSSTPVTLSTTGDLYYPSDWGVKGLLYQANASAHIVSVLPDASSPKPGPPVNLMDRAFIRGALSQFRVSPNGLWVAYHSQETGTSEIYLGRFPDFADKRQISSSGGAEPRWSKDGREIFYRAPDRSIMSVEIRQNGGSLETGAPKALFLANLSGTPSNTDYGYDVSADGQQFLIEETDGGIETESIHVVVNWQALLAH